MQATSGEITEAQNEGLERENVENREEQSQSQHGGSPITDVVINYLKSGVPTAICTPASGKNLQKKV